MIISIVSMVIIASVFLLLFYLRHKSNPVSLGLSILASLLLGAGAGLLLRKIPMNFQIVHDVLLLLGKGYLGMLKMLVVPLILTSVIHAVLNLSQDDSSATPSNQEVGTLKRLSLLACCLLLLMTSLSSLIGALVGIIMRVGEGINLSGVSDRLVEAPLSLIDTLLKMLPVNPVDAMTKENCIAVVIFAVLFGLAARKLEEVDHDKKILFSRLIAALFAITKKLTKMIITFTPYGVFALSSILFSSQGFIFLKGLLNFVIAMYLAMGIVVVMHSIILYLSTGLSPVYYFKKAYTPLFVAFTTRSSFATLPVTEETLHGKFHLKQVTSTLVPSMGATIGMNACAGVFPAMLVVMTSVVMHQSVTWHLILSVMFINALASLGTSGLPGTAFIAASVTLTSLNYPLTLLGLVQGIDPIVDMGRTAVNVNGVMTSALASERLTAYNTQIFGRN